MTPKFYTAPIETRDLDLNSSSPVVGIEGKRGNGIDLGEVRRP